MTKGEQWTHIKTRHPKIAEKMKQGDAEDLKLFLSEANKHFSIKSIRLKEL